MNLSGSERVCVSELVKCRLLLLLLLLLLLILNLLASIDRNAARLREAHTQELSWPDRKPHFWLLAQANRNVTHKKKKGTIWHCRAAQFQISECSL